jgi:hypothetical protein
LDRIFLRRLGARTECKVAARCGKIPIGLLETGPRFFLLRRQLQSGMQRSDTRVKKGRTIFLPELLPPPEVRTTGGLLGIGRRSRDEHQCGGAGRDDLEHGSLLAEELSDIETTACARMQVTFELNIHYTEAIFVGLLI